MRKIVTILFLCLISFSCQKEYFSKNYNDPIYVFDSFWNEVDRHYSYFTYSKLNWDSIKTAYRSQIDENTSSQTLFLTLGKMINLLKDGHTNLFGTLGTVGYDNWYKNFPSNQLKSTRQFFSNYVVYSTVFDYGNFKNSNFGYIYLKTFDSLNDRKKYEAIDTILNILKSTDGLIIDVRSNGGGNSTYSDLIASRFAQSKKFIFKYRARNGPGHDDFTDWREFYLTPNTLYTKPVVVLTNRKSFSATESFVIDMKAQPSVTICGDTTGGGSSNPLIRELPNGWIIRVSNTQRVTFEGRDYQFTGIYPDVPVWITQSNTDAIIENALKILQNNLNR